MGWYVWNKDMESTSPETKCQYCGKPITIGQPYYLFGHGTGKDPFNYAHAACHWKATDKEEGE